MAKERHREKEKKRDRKAETLNHLSIHQWVRSAIFAPHQLASPIGFPFLKLPPPPCAVLLVGGMFTIPKWVVYDIVFPTILVNDLGKVHHELTVLPHEKKDAAHEPEC